MGGSLVADQISLQQLEKLLRNPDVPDSELRQYFTGDPGLSSPFAPGLRIDPAVVALPEDSEYAVRAATMMSSLNGLARWRRRARFNQRLGSNRPIVLAEGDSWFQFPMLLDDVVDHLCDVHGYNVDCVSAAGDTLSNMVDYDKEYLDMIEARGNGSIAAFIFSGAGNDVIGEDPVSKKPAIEQLVKLFDGTRGPAAMHIDQPKLDAVLKFIDQRYRRVIAEARELRPDLHIVIHSYANAIPGGHPGDERKPIYAAQDQWLGRAFKNRGYRDREHQAEIVAELVRQLHETLAMIAQTNRNVTLVDVRKILPKISDWNDEIHPTNDGFKKVAAAFDEVIKAKP